MMNDSNTHNKLVDIFLKSVCAGIFIVIGCTVYLSTYQENKFIGALLFSIALFVICFYGYSLYTGKVGYLLSKDVDLLNLIITLIGNLVGVVLFGILIRESLPNLQEVSTHII